MRPKTNGLNPNIRSITGAMEPLRLRARCIYTQFTTSVAEVQRKSFKNSYRVTKQTLTPNLTLYITYYDNRKKKITNENRNEHSRYKHNGAKKVNYYRNESFYAPKKLEKTHTLSVHVCFNCSRKHVWNQRPEPEKCTKEYLASCLFHWKIQIDLLNGGSSLDAVVVGRLRQHSTLCDNSIKKPFCRIELQQQIAWFGSLIALEQLAIFRETNESECAHLCSLHT